jgi:hypothetical protein
MNTKETKIVFFYYKREELTEGLNNIIMLQVEIVEYFMERIVSDL